MLMMADLVGNGFALSSDLRLPSLLSNMQVGGVW
jgi:hypothetical protein